MTHQLSLFEPMESPLLTAEQLEEQTWYMKNETIYPHMTERWKQLKAERRHYDALAIATEFIVRQ